MSTELTDDRRVEPLLPTPDLGALAEQLVAAARASGVELTGPARLLTGLTRQVMETALDGGQLPAGAEAILGVLEAHPGQDRAHALTGSPGVQCGPPGSRESGPLAWSARVRMA